MAKFNEILVGRFNRSLQKLVGIKGEAPAPQLATEFMPGFTYPLGNEFRFLESWFRYSCLEPVVGGAAQFAGFRARLPKNSNIVAVIEQLVIAVPAGAADLIAVRVDVSNSTDLPNPIAGNRQTPIDNRPGPQLVPNLIISNSTNVGSLIANYDAVPVPLNGRVALMLVPTDELTILPDMMLNIASTVAANTINVAMRWRERPLEESELK